MKVVVFSSGVPSTVSGVPVTVRGKVPVGVEALVAIVRVLEQGGLHGLRLKVAAAPGGSPEAARVTACVVPVRRVAVISPELTSA